MPLKELIEMEEMTLKNHTTIEVHSIENGAFSIDFISADGEREFYEYLTRAECVQLAQMLLRVSDTEEDKE